MLTSTAGNNKIAELDHYIWHSRIFWVFIIGNIRARVRCFNNEIEIDVMQSSRKECLNTNTCTSTLANLMRLGEHSMRNVNTEMWITKRIQNCDCVCRVIWGLAGN